MILKHIFRGTSHLCVKFIYDRIDLNKFHMIFGLILSRFYFAFVSLAFIAQRCTRRNKNDALSGSIAFEGFFHVYDLHCWKVHANESSWVFCSDLSKASRCECWGLATIEFESFFFLFFLLQKFWKSFFYENWWKASQKDFWSLKCFLNEEKKSKLWKHLQALRKTFKL